jgi:putative ABC transport system permease protein
LHEHPGRREAIINQTMAKHFFADRDPLGRTLSFDGDQHLYYIVGVVGDAKYMEIREDSLPTAYLNAFQESWVPSQFALRSNIDPAALAPEVQRTVEDSLKTIPTVRTTTLDEQVDASIVPERLIAMLSGWFGALGALLAAIGLYGLLAYAVARRTNEIGIRMALGATQGNVLCSVLKDALVMVCMGVLIGAPVAFWGKQLAASLVREPSSQGAAPILLGVFAMVTVALIAAYLPAQRAARVDPIEALRRE